MALLPTIRRLVDERPTYGCRRITAPLNRERRKDGPEPVNRKRVPRIMQANSLVLMRRTGQRLGAATSIAVEIVRRKPDRIGFAAQPRRWVVERFFAWISRNRRLWKDTEATIASAIAFLYAAAVLIRVRRLARLK